MSLSDQFCILAGPIVRKITPQQIVFWLATSHPARLTLEIQPENQAKRRIEMTETDTCHCLEAARYCYFHLIDIRLDEPLPQETWIGYDFLFAADMQNAEADAHQFRLTELADDICYPDKQTPGFVIRSRIKHILHGSCRKPHHKANRLDTDGLVIADEYLSTCIDEAQNWPALIMMSGDQVYADDVATPMLVAIHRLVEQMKWPNETFQGAQLIDSQSLKQNAELYFQREKILPKDEVDGEVKQLLFSSVKKPIFTSDNAHNHLISLEEVFAMYLLVWSPEAWQFTGLSMPKGLSEQARSGYQDKQAILEQFISGLPKVRRVMAHLPCAMIFDDHDITDDWNLTANWERIAYQNDFSRRILGNALLAYFVCQGWGNAPQNFPDELIELAQAALIQPGAREHEKLISRLLKYEHWHYSWQTKPKLVVVDSRTQRWQSLSRPDSPSGLMDWEALTQLQLDLLDQNAVILVSPAPIFGVKLIEAIQRLFTWFGKPLMVDAENWMAHKGAAYTLLNMFRHPKTPQHFVILSGDVHYSYVFSIGLKGRKNSPHIWQITSSGLRNEFPQGLLNWLDRLNRWLYAPWSPLNWFTKRKHMRVEPVKPGKASRGERLLNQAGIGLVELNEHGEPVKIVQLVKNEAIDFKLSDNN